MLLNATDGGLLKIFITVYVDEVFDSYFYDSQTLLILTKSSFDSLSYLFAYHLSNSSFIVYKLTDSTITIRDISYSSISNRRILFGDINGDNIYAAYTLFDLILDFNGIQQETTYNFGEANASSYPLDTTSVSNPATDTFIVDDNGGSLTTSDRNMSISLDQYTDVVYYFDTPTNSEYFTLVEGWNETLPINITCSINGDVSLEHVIEDYDNHTAPTWVTLDEANNQLVCSVPEVTSDTDYYLRIKTNELGSSVNYYITVNLTVLN